MPASDTAVGIVVGHLDYGEADRIVTFLTRERGRLKGIARFARKSRKRFGAALDLFCKVQVRYVERPGADLVRLEGVDLVDAYPGLRSDLRRVAAVTYAAELAREAAPEREAASHLFDLFDRFIARIAREAYDPWLVRAFELQALAVLGWRPVLDRCARCGAALAEDRSIHFAAESGGTLCARCGAGRRGWALSPGTVRTLRAALAGERVSFTRSSLRESDAPIADFLEHSLGRRLRSRSFLATAEA